MATLIIIGIYVLVAAWLFVDSHVNAGKVSAGNRLASYFWGSTGAVIMGFFVVAWWFVRSFVGAFWKFVTGSNRIQPTYRETDRAKDWILFPQELLAKSFTGRGKFRWTPK